MTDTLQAPPSSEIPRPARKLADISQTPRPPLGDAPISPDRYWSKEFAQKEWDHVWTISPSGWEPRPFFA
jgi:hypothetical protein